MTVLECVIAAAHEIGIEESVLSYTQKNDASGEAATMNLVRCFNLVENTLALDYLPLLAEDTLQTETGAIYFSELEKSPVRIIGVSDISGEDLAFVLFPEYLKTQAGKVKIKYSYAPQEKSLSGVSDYLLHASVRLFAYGMAAEYFAASGLFEEAAVWEKKYQKAIQAAYQRQPSKRIRSRRWV